MRDDASGAGAGIEPMSEGSSAAGAGAAEGRTVRLTIPAKPEYITVSRLALTGLSRVRPFADETLADLKLALTEATSNSVRHAYADGEGRIQITFELREDRLIVEVSDDGSGFDYPGAESPASTERQAERRDRDGTAEDIDELSEGGLGIEIIRSIADEVELGSGPSGGSRLRFTKLI
ncbi:MAG: ATP-binding protein [Actinobacteria bacterium]|nr:ATP-binding protein [Actinomycetota bacterium]